MAFVAEDMVAVKSNAAPHAGAPLYAVGGRKRKVDADMSRAEGASKKDVDPSFELRYAMERIDDQTWRVGGPTGDADGRIDETTYRWTVSADGAAHWRIVDPKALDGDATAWLSIAQPNKANDGNGRSAAKTLVTLMVNAGQRKWLPKPDSRRNFVPLRGQYLSIEATGDIHCFAPDPIHGLTYCVPATFDPAKVSDGRYHPQPVDPKGCFGRYLASTFADDGVRDLAQEAFATVLINRCFEKSIWMYGDGENGKSVALHILNAVVGGRSAAIKLPRLVRDHFGTASLHGARLAMVSEVPKSLTSEMQDTLKELISWDAQPLEKKGRDAFTFRPTAVWLLASNAFPRVSQHEHGFWRKVLTLPFTQRVKAEDKITDYHLLITENPAEMAQVIDWLLVGAQRLIRRGGKFPDVLPASVADLAQQQRLDSDPVAAYISDSVEVDDTTWTSKMRIYTDYVAWCQQRGRHPLNDTGFWDRLRATFRGVDLGNRQGPAVDGRRDRYVNLKVDGVVPLEAHRWPQGWLPAGTTWDDAAA